MNSDAVSRAHLLARLSALEMRVRQAVERRRADNPKPDDAFRGLYLADEDVDRVLDAHPTPIQSEEADRAASKISTRAASLEDGGCSLRLHSLSRAFGLSELDLDVLVTALAPDVDARFEKLFGYLHDDVTRRRASIGLALELAGASADTPEARTRFDPTAPLVRGQLLIVEEADRPFLTRSLRVPDRVVAHLLGSDDRDPTLDGTDVKPTLVLGTEALAIERAIRAGARLIYLRERTSQSAPGLAAQAAAALETGALVVDLSRAANHATIAEAALREARLLNVLLVLGPVDELTPESIDALGTSRWPTVLHGRTGWDARRAREPVLALDVQRRDHSPLPELPGFRLGPTDLARTRQVAELHAAAEGTAISPRHLTLGARAQNASGLERLARRIEPAVTWDDLVLPATTLADIEHLVVRVQQRGRVMNDWGLHRGGARGEGVTALFVGDSGTGKTMTAEVIAHALGLELYCVDLSSIVDKYIGETEKNLERIFSEAEGVNAVLFFDEADALFGKRSEVSDAKDRYANVEVAYLLQRLETFDGLAILATNLRANLDEAFLRRLSVVVEFPKPDEEQRQALWRKSLGAVPLDDDVDLDFCAQAFELSGGNIRNIAVTAAYLAASNGQVAHMRDLVQATQWEYRKLGRLCVEAEFGQYFDLVASGR